MNPLISFVNGTKHPELTAPLFLDGYQAVLKPSKYGYSLSAIVDEDMVKQLEPDRVDSLKWAESKLKNPKRSTLKPEPWEEVSRR